jgi:hypothetical protein
MTNPDVLNHGWWLASRSAGIVAIVLVTVAVIAGLLLGGRMTRRPGMAKVVKTVHEQAALTGLVAIAVHALTLVADPWLKPGVVGVLVPFTMDYRPVWTGLGVVAGELAALLGLSPPSPRASDAARSGAPRDRRSRETRRPPTDRRARRSARCSSRRRARSGAGGRPGCR